ncbi:MAG: crossover junction endodeoxyribonuclease RuvC [Bacteroidota bacterium]
MPDVILGIDPGSRTTGYAVLSEHQGKLVAVRCDVIRLAHEESHAKRLNIIYEKLSSIIKSIKPTACAIEIPLYGVDPLAMLKLGRAQAAAMLAITQQGLDVQEYYPKEVKKAITGNGNSGKEQVAFMLRKMIELPEDKLPNDATDALAVAWCHLTKSNLPVSATSKKGHQNNAKSGWADFISKNPERVKGL